MRIKHSSVWLGLLLVLCLLLVFGCGDSEQATQEEEEQEPEGPIKIGFSGALTGPYSEFGEGLRRAYEVAIDEWNSNGGINGREIVLITRDDQLDPSKALTNVIELIEVEEVDLLMGPAGSGPTMAALPVAIANNIIFISYAATDEAVYPDGIDQPPYPNVFVFMVLNSTSAEALAHYAASNFEKIGIIVESTTYGTDTRDWIIHFLENNYGITPVGTEVYDQKDADMTAQLARLQRAEAEVVLITGLGADAAVVKQGMNRLNFDAHFHGDGGVFSLPYFEVAGELAIGTTGTLPTVYVGPPVRQEAITFSEKYYEKWGNDRWYGEGEWPPPFFAYSSYGYDSINVLLEAVERAGTTDTDAVIQEMYNTNYAGAAWDITFTPEKHHAYPYEFVGVAEITFGDAGIAVERMQ